MTHSFWRSLLFTLILAIGLQGCYSLNHQGTAVQEKIEITDKTGSGEVISTFEETKTINHFIFGLVSPDDAGIEEIVSNAVRKAGGTGAVNVRISYQQKFVNGLVNVITFGIYGPFTLTIKGDIVK